MNTTTTASIDLAQLDALVTYHSPHGQMVRVEDLHVIARRSLTSGAPAEPIYQVQYESEKGTSAWHDATEEAYHTFMPERRRIISVHDAAAPSAADDGKYMHILPGYWKAGFMGEPVHATTRGNALAAYESGVAFRASMSAGAAAKSEQGGEPNAYDEAAAKEAWGVVCRNRLGLPDYAQAAIRDALLAPLQHAPAAGAGSAQPRAEGDERAMFEATMGAGILADQGEFALSRAYSDGRPYTFLATIWAWKAWQARAALARAPLPAESAKPVAMRDALRRSGANTDYHGLIAFTQAQFKHFVSMIAAPAQPVDDARDAARYRFIEEHATMHGGGNGFTITCFVGIDEEDMGVGIDKMIAAMRANDSAAEGGANHA